VVGAGLVGLATALKLLQHDRSLRVRVIEAGSDLATGQSGHNSGVIHAGVYYPAGSLKARLCREGRAELLHFAVRHQVPHVVRGKLIVAAHGREFDRLDDLHSRSVENGLQAVQLLEPRDFLKIEPNVQGERALHVPESAVTDFRLVARAYAAEVDRLGGQIDLNWKVTRLEHRADSWSVESHGRRVTAGTLVCCAGLSADRLWHLAGAAESGYRIVPFRGSYSVLARPAATLVRGLIYPVPDPSLPFLGVHFTRGVDDEVRVGPNAVPSLTRDHDSRFVARDIVDTLAYTGFRRLARRQLRTGAGEVWRDRIKRAALRDARRYVPNLPKGALFRGGYGIRAQLVQEDGSLVDDFVVAEQDGALHVLNAPSPAATASLAIGRQLANRVLGLRSDIVIAPTFPSGEPANFAMARHTSG